MQQPLPPMAGLPPGLPTLPGVGYPPVGLPPGGFPGLAGLPPGGFPGLPGFLGATAPPPGLPGVGAPPPGLPGAGAPPGLPALDWSQFAAAQGLAGAPPPGALGLPPPGLPGWPGAPGLPAGFPPPQTALPGPGAPGLPAGFPPPQTALPANPATGGGQPGWGQPSDTLAALLGPPADGAAGLASTTAPGAMPPQLPSMTPPQMPPQMPQMPTPPPPQVAPAPPAPVPGAREAAAREAAALNEQRAQERRQRESREQAERRANMEKLEKMKCHLHKKAKDSCKFCKKYKDAVEEIEKRSSQNDSSMNKNDGKRRRKLDRAISEEGAEGTGRARPLEIANTKNFGLGGLLQTHIVECAHFKSLMTLETFDQLLDETYQFAQSVEPYMTNSGTVPSALFCCLYRFFTMALDSRMLRRLLNNQESPYLRAAGFLYVRYGLAHDQLWDWLGEYILDDETFQFSPENEQKTTIGEYVEGLLALDKYFNTVFPRLPNSTRRKLEEKLAPVPQYRKRTKANKEIVDMFKDPGTKIEACIEGDWLKGTVLELDDDRPTRVKVQVRLEDGTEETVHLGMMILSDNNRNPTRRARGRSRSRSPGGSRIDWSREKGRSDKELVDEMRSREREKAVCSSGKDYARKPVGYKAACALPREQGTASYRLMEEETFVPMNRGERRARSPSPAREQSAFGKRQSAEHQQRMQQLFEKYGNVKSAEARQQNAPEVDRPDVMRLG